MTYRKKLIEVALPLDAINEASAREKSIRHGHPSTLHLWWARRPLAACRAVLFSSLVNDPSDDPMYSGDEEKEDAEREQLFKLIRELVKWDNSNNSEVINKARLEIARSIAANKVADEELADGTQLVSTAPELPEAQSKYLPDPPLEYTPYDVRFKVPELSPEQVNHFLAHHAPPVLDPFAGGGSIPLEAQRLGLRAYASDLNPVPVLINKALIEIPSQFAGVTPINPAANKGKPPNYEWHGAEGLADDIRYYGEWLQEKAIGRLGHLYDSVEVTQAMVDEGRHDLEPLVGQKLKVIAWLWARTVRCTNPACGGDMPMFRSLWLSKKKGQEKYLEAVINHKTQQTTFTVKSEGLPADGTSNRQKARCIYCNNEINKAQLREQATKHGIGRQALSVVVMAKRSRVFLDSTAVSEHEVKSPESDFLDQLLPDDKRWFSPPLYGLTRYRDIFTDRQITTLLTLCELMEECVRKITSDLEGLRTKNHSEQYAQAVATYLGLAISRMTDICNSLCMWEPSKTQVRHVFTRHAIPMLWDYAEPNVFSGSAGDFMSSCWSFIPSNYSRYRFSTRCNG